MTISVGELLVTAFHDLRDGVTAEGIVVAERIASWLPIVPETTQERPDGVMLTQSGDVSRAQATQSSKRPPRLCGEDHLAARHRLPAIYASTEFARGLVTGGTLFEELGFYYIGPIDGHNLDHLLPVLKNVRDTKQGPILLHVISENDRVLTAAEALDLRRDMINTARGLAARVEALSVAAPAARDRRAARAFPRARPTLQGGRDAHRGGSPHRPGVRRSNRRRL